jgi:hypothetical protein
MMNKLHSRFFTTAVLCTGLSFLLMLFNSCSGSRKISSVIRHMQQDERADADSLLSYALDHEALYTLMDTLKPISSVKLIKLPLLSKDKRRADSARAALERWTKLVQQMQLPDLRFILQPFERNEGDDKYVEIYAVRLSVLQKKLKEQASFYQTIGLTQDAAAETVLAITEFENKYQRWRSYGYLFGYPSYAVDFFVQAGKEQDSTGKFVQRDFFAIPVQAANTGYFTYAIPKGYKTDITDSTIYHKATQTLTAYSVVLTKIKTGSLIKYVYKSNKKMQHGK